MRRADGHGAPTEPATFPSLLNHGCSMTVQAPSRSGGRTARRMARSSALPDHLRAIRPGMSCAALNVLSAADMDAIHEAALTALEEIGLADAPESGVVALTTAGAIHGPDGRIRIPRNVVETALGLACREITLCGRGVEAGECLLVPEGVENRNATAEGDGNER